MPRHGGSCPVTINLWHCKDACPLLAAGDKGVDVVHPACAVVAAEHEQALHAAGFSFSWCDCWLWTRPQSKCRLCVTDVLCRSLRLLSQQDLHCTEQACAIYTSIILGLSHHEIAVALTD